MDQIGGLFDGGKGLVLFFIFRLSAIKHDNDFVS